ncbi:MAG TPA: hypothetical protein VGR53_10910 [Nitrososphaerales archaeon]|nr:hypothetical protein [Nitrososphaerales archaeon]
MVDLFLSWLTGLVLLAYLALDAGASLSRKKEDSKEPGRRIASILAIVVFSSAAVSLVISQSSTSSPSPVFEGPIMSGLWALTLIVLIALSWSLYRKVRARSKSEAQAQVKVADYIDQQVAGRMRPLEGAVVDLSNRFANLSEEIRKLPPAVQDQAKAIRYQTKTMVTINNAHGWREQQYREVMAQYNKWYEQRGEASRKLDSLINGAETMLEKFSLFSDQVEEVIDSLGMESREPLTEGGAGVQPEQGGDQTPQNPPLGGAILSLTGGKLTKEKGMANREKGNRAQLQFSEEVLRKANKAHDTSFKEGAADFVFYVPDTRIAKAVGAFKALTLSEGGTKQRWIPRRKMLAEQRLALKLGVPLILFVRNLLNGRIWAKVLAVEELKAFTGLTTPLMLIENDPRAEKTCKETLEMALQLL